VAEMFDTTINLTNVNPDPWVGHDRTEH
jgi:hypothetical protein